MDIGEIIETGEIHPEELPYLEPQEEPDVRESDVDVGIEEEEREFEYV